VWRTHRPPPQPPARVAAISCANDVPVFHGTRSVVLALAQHRPRPTETHDSKFSPWAPKHVIYAFYSDSLLEGAHQQFKAYKNSKFYHSRTGKQTDAAAAETGGSLDLKRIHCACARCKAPIYDFANCLVPNIVGRSTKVDCKRVTGAAGATTQTQALADFAVKLKNGACWPVRVAEDERNAEGRYWLASVVGEPERLVDSMTYAGQTFHEGWIVVKAKWYCFVRERVQHARVYRLLQDTAYIPVSAFIRVEGAVKLQRDAASRSTPKPLILSVEEQTRITDAL
jgi:hypothetical protein